ncbi:MAG: hypothetical protein FVQ82_02615 [Planctomycetes bacterium]|nr:hypothetical protein [Planctomycetota bacterium]
MGWNLNRLFRSQVGLFYRLAFYRKPINALKRDLTTQEKESIEAMICGLGWVADSNMARVPETDCISIMVVTPIRIVMAAGELTTDIEYHEIADCYWIEDDFCLEAMEKEKELGMSGFRYSPKLDKSDVWTEHRRDVFKEIILRHVKESSQML